MKELPLVVVLLVVVVRLGSVAFVLNNAQLWLLMPVSELGALTVVGVLGLALVLEGRL